MAGGNGDNEELIAEINLTPLVDISLVLVIIFMVVAPFLTHILKPLHLPSAAHTAITEQNAMNISVFPDRTLAFGSTVMPEQDLAVRIKEEIAAGRRPWALVRAGMEVSHGRVMDIVKLLKDSGVQRIAFATEARAPDTGRDNAPGTEGKKAP